ncbi:NADH:ubiquinone oxidoreductase subunit 39 [Tachypleus tridentatus]|uniref:NADH:ubiquinone oxidoreductase subunit 39 n=1 Tax=Tachypleus tridentatus TaxID=6853 RepID=UPI003FD21BA9
MVVIQVIGRSSRHHLPGLYVVTTQPFQQKYLCSNAPVKKFPPPGTDLPSLKRGTGGRSSFNGVVATVFGATGFLGRYLVNKLGKIGTQVIIPYRGESYDVLRLRMCGDLGQILFFPFHLSDEDSLYKVMKYSNVVINLIGRDFETRNFTFDDVHVEGAKTIARIAKDCGVQRFVHMSALNAAEKPKPVILKSGSQFLASKWAGEQAVRQEFPETTVFRPADMYGHEDRFLRYYSHFWRRNIRNLPLWKKGRETIKQPVFVSDVAEAIVNSIFDPDAVGKTFEAIGPRRYELGELVDWFHLLMKKDADWGYKRTDLRYDLIFQTRIFFTEKVIGKYPLLSWERVEREHVTDTPTRGVPSLEDLGITLTYMEDRVPFELRPFRALAYYDTELGEFEKPPAPPAPIM